MPLHRVCRLHFSRHVHLSLCRSSLTMRVTNYDSPYPWNTWKYPYSTAAISLHAPDRIHHSSPECPGRHKRFLAHRPRRPATEIKPKPTPVTDHAQEPLPPREPEPANTSILELELEPEPEATSVPRLEPTARSISRSASHIHSRCACPIISQRSQLPPLSQSLNSLKYMIHYYHADSV